LPGAVAVRGKQGWLKQTSAQPALTWRTQRRRFPSGEDLHGVLCGARWCCAHVHAHTHTVCRGKARVFVPAWLVRKSCVCASWCEAQLHMLALPSAKCRTCICPRRLQVMARCSVCLQRACLPCFVWRIPPAMLLICTPQLPVRTTQFSTATLAPLNVHTAWPPPGTLSSLANR
jgi:hypothetical protein